METPKGNRQDEATMAVLQSAPTHETSALKRVGNSLTRMLRSLSRREWLFLGMLLLAYLFFLSPANTNTISRYDMVSSLARGTAIIDDRASNTIDVSFYNGHYYSPRSIGLSLVAVPILRIARAIAPVFGGAHAIEQALNVNQPLTLEIALLSLFTVVPAALAASVVFWRFVLRLRPESAGTPLPLVVTSAFALGTFFYPIGTLFFSHAFGGGLDLIGFYLLYRARNTVRPWLPVAGAGLLVGYAVISEYPTALIALVLGAYVLFAFPGDLRYRLTLLLVFGAAMIPSALILGWYNWFAFGNPLHMSYEFVSDPQFAGQHQGLFGITLPHPAALWQILVWPHGLLVESPFLIFIVPGFWRWLRSAARPPAEALVCLTITILYALLVSSYFLPMAGENLPGPRLLVPMLPFACLSLAWVVDDARRWFRGIFAALLAFGLVLSFLYVALGVREYHTYLTYPIADLYWPLLSTGSVRLANGHTPPNLAHLLLHLDQGISIYVLLIPLLVWTGYLVSALLRYPKNTDTDTRENARTP
ncbi:MAG: hypothetical protein ACXWP6_12460 [Ktedonobacterales bacterium]